MKIIKAPGSLTGSPRPLVFLAGSIEMGDAPDWQREVEIALMDRDGTIANPRRDDWDSSWVQRASNPQFRQQVTWELDALNEADHIALYLAPGTKSPISLLELGLFHNRSMIVCCPDGFWRKGNVEIVCDRYSIELVASLGNFIDRLRERVK